MFVGMALALVVYEVRRFLVQRRPHDSLLQSSDPPSLQTVSHWKFYFYVGVPALSDLIATTLSNIGLLFIEANAARLDGSLLVNLLRVHPKALPLPVYVVVCSRELESR
jgi:hypothetical protein